MQRKKLILVVILLSLGLGVLFWRYTGSILERQKEENKIVELTIWGLGEDEKIIRPIIDRYSVSHPKIKINYVKQSPLNYPSRVQTRIRAGTGPDIFWVHSSWIPMFTSDLLPVPSSMMSLEDFSQNFYPVAKDTLVAGDKIYALPLEIDGLALYYNEEILKAAGVNPPTNWQEFKEGAAKVTVRNQAGQIQTAGAAMGTTANVDFWPEIIGLLFLQQPNGNLNSPANKDGVEVLQFFISFVIDPRIKTWDVTLPSSTQMFKEGRLAFYFAPAHKASEIKSANPNLPFRAMAVPKLAGREIGWGNFWAQGVSIRSKHPDEVWEFLKLLNTTTALQVMNKQRNALGLPPRPYPKPTMAPLQKDDQFLGAFVTQATIFKGGYLNSGIAGWGVNEEMINLYRAAVDAVLQGQDPLGALQTAETGIKQVLDKYKVNEFTK